MPNPEVRTEQNLWSSAQFQAYLASTAFTGGAFSMQQLLISWMLVGILVLPGDQVGLIQAIIGIPALFLMLLGGASADRADPRLMLIRIYAVAWVIPLLLVTLVEFDLFNVWTVMLFGLGVSTVTAYTSPAQQAVLSRVAGNDIQRAVTVSTAIGFLVQIVGLMIAGQMERVGLTAVLVSQSVCIALGAVTIARLQKAEVNITPNLEPTWRNVVAGLHATYANKNIFELLIVNFVSSIFNAGAFITVVPFIIKRAYNGDALQLAIIMIVFYFGATLSGLVMLRFMPMLRPGRIFLIMQLSRVVILGFLWIKPDWWLLILVMIAWGLNMGLTTTLARAIVQESAAPEFRARILSVYSIGLLGSAPIGALLLGMIIEGFGTLNALIPAMFVSVALFLYGVLATGIWSYRSPQA